MSILAKAPTFRPFTLALIQLGQIGASKPDNLRHARDMVLKAAAGGASGKKPDVIVLPECFNSPYGASFFPEYAEHIGYVPGRRYDVEAASSESVKMLSSVAKETGTWLIGGSIPEKDAGKLFNTCTVYSPQGELIAIHRKVHLFDIDIPGKVTFKESETLSGGSNTNFFDTEFARIGLGICYDIRFPELAAVSARRGCHLLVYPGAFNTTTGPLHWELLQKARAIDNQVYVSMVSPARNPASNYQAYGHTMVINPWGEVLCEADENECILYTDITPDKFNEVRAHIPVTTQRRFDVYDDVSTNAK